MPMPRSIQKKNGEFRVPNQGIQFSVNGNFNPRLHENINWFKKRLSKKTAIPFLPNRGKFISIQVNRPGEVGLGEDESYKITINNLNVNIVAETDLGAIHALETLLQLAVQDEKGYYFPAIIIDDNPRFPWRGLMIDVSRHFIPIDVIKRNIDAMSMVKLNVLHLHLTDDQGFRVECKKFPQLHQKGSNGEFFTQDEIKQIIRYADMRGIRVVPEFDMPGHTTAWMVGMPELASAPGPYEVEKHFGVFDPTIDPTIRSSYRILSKFLKEMAKLFHDEYMHIGGDENNGKQWDQNADIQEYMNKKGIKNNHELQSYFNSKLLKILRKNDKKMMGWDEIYEPDLPKDIVIHSWRGYNYMYRAAKQGYQSVLSNGYYIDLSHNAIKHYIIDPLPDTTTLTPQEQQRILGGEAPIWAELADAENVESRIWPRTAAIAERLWSQNPPASEEDMYRRLFIISHQLEEAGIRHLANREPMMRRLAGKNDIDKLMILANAAEPLEGYRRHGSQRYTTYHPLSRFVDISLPDAPDAITFRLLLKRFIESKSIEELNGLNTQLLIWQQNHTLIDEDIANNINLREIELLSVNLKILASTTGILLKIYSESTKISASESRSFSTLLDKLSKPVAEMELPLADDAKLILSLIEVEE
jgi:hexosaminidase